MKNGRYGTFARREDGKIIDLSKECLPSGTAALDAWTQLKEEAVNNTTITKEKGEEEK